MKLSVKEAAALLGKSARTVRLHAQTGKLPAKRVDDRWEFDRDELLDAVPAAAAARREQVDRMRSGINAALDQVAPPEPDSGRRFYSVRDLRVFTHAQLALAELHALCGSHRELTAARDALLGLARTLTEGCHQYHPRRKLDLLLRARTEACAALADVLSFNRMQREPDLTSLADRIEGELRGGVRGLIRRMENKSKEDAA